MAPAQDRIPTSIKSDAVRQTGGRAQGIGRSKGKGKGDEG